MKGKVIGIIVGIVVLWLLIGLFLFNKNMFLGGHNNYKLVKLLDYSEKEYNYNGTAIYKVDKYYVLAYSVDYKNTFVIYDKKGNDVTKEVFGVDNILYIDGIESIDNNTYTRLIVSTKDGKYGLYDMSFKEIIPFGNYYIERTTDNNYYMVGEMVEEYPNDLENVGVYDKDGKVVIPREYERLFMGNKYNDNTSFKDNEILFYARKDNRYGIIDKGNKVIIPFEYDRQDSKLSLGLGEIINSNGNYYFILYKDGKYGVVDSDNKIIIPFNKEKIFYDKNANVVIEDANSKVNVYGMDGILKKEIVLSDSFKADFYAYYIGIDSHFVLYDDDYVYELKSNMEYEKHVRPANMELHWSVNRYFIGNKIYFKNSGEKYKIYNVNDNSLYSEDEYYLMNGDDIGSSKDIILCLDKVDDYYSKCGIIDYDGKVIADFNYNSFGLNLWNREEYIDYIYNRDIQKYEIKHVKVNGECVNNDKYYFNDKIISVDNSIYDLKCNKIADDVYNYEIMNDNFVMIQKKETKKFEIYNINTYELANIEGLDTVNITNYIRTYSVDEPLIMTDNGVYRVVEY